MLMVTNTVHGCPWTRGRATLRQSPRCFCDTPRRPLRNPTFILTNKIQYLGWIPVLMLDILVPEIKSKWSTNVKCHTRGGIQSKELSLSIGILDVFFSLNCKHHARNCFESPTSSKSNVQETQNCRIPLGVCIQVYSSLDPNYGV